MEFHHLGLEVNSLEESLEFYIHLCRFQLEEELTLAGERIIFLTKGELRLELTENKETSSWHICFEVKEFPALLPGAADYQKYENGWESAFFHSQDGHLIELLKRK